MAVLNTAELAELRQSLAEGKVVSWTKPQINAGLQAIEDWFEANKGNLGSAIEAVAPGAFNAARKKELVAYWLRQKFRREGV